MIISFSSHALYIFTYCHPDRRPKKEAKQNRVDNYPIQIPVMLETNIQRRLMGEEDTLQNQNSDHLVLKPYVIHIYSLLPRQHLNNGVVIKKRKKGKVNIGVWIIS